MPNFGAIADFLGAAKNILAGVIGFAGSLENPLPPFLAGGEK